MGMFEISVVVVIVAVLVAGFAMIVNSRRRRTGRLRERFGGAEYDRALSAGGKRQLAEKALESRAARVASFHLRPLAAADRVRFGESWSRVQTRFVDAPAGAVAEADELVGELMSTRGYPVSDFEQRAADLSVDHPSVTASYRSAHEIVTRQRQEQIGTEDLRQAMIHYRELFDELVGAPKAA